MLGNSIDNLQITLLDDLTTTLKVTDCQLMQALQKMQNAFFTSMNGK